MSRDQPKPGRTLIIGYGNPLRSDDGLGWHAAERLCESLSSPTVEVLTRQQLTADLAAPVSEASTVFFIDAAQDGEPGDLTCKEIQPESWTPSFSHELSPGGVLAVAEELYGARPKAYLMSLCGECFDHGEKLSAKVQASLPQLITLVREAASAQARPRRANC